MYQFSFSYEALRISPAGKKFRQRKDITLDIPTKVTEIPLRAWADFTKLRDEAPDVFSELDLADIEDASRVIAPEKWTAFLSHALKVIHTLAANRKDIAREDLLNLPLGTTAAKSEAADGLLAILAMIMRPIAEYEPGPRDIFEHDGHRYAFYADYLDQFNQEWVGRDLRMAESVDALHMEQIYFMRDEEGQLYEPDAKYKNSLALLALLTRRVEADGSLEQPPVDLIDRTEWLDRRMLALAGVSMDVALDIDFFLPASKTLSRRIRSFLSLGRRAKRPQA